MKQVTKIDKIKGAIKGNGVGVRSLDVFEVYGIDQSRDQSPNFIDIDVYEAYTQEEYDSGLKKMRKITEMLLEAGLDTFEVHDGKITFFND